jgi:hypothetical protein
MEKKIFFIFSQKLSKKKTVDSGRVEEKVVEFIPMSHLEGRSIFRLFSTRGLRKIEESKRYLVPKTEV